MRKIGLLLLIMAMATTGFSQGLPMGGGGGRRGGAGQVPSIGHFYGKVVDSKTGKGMDGASVQLILTKYDAVKRGQKDTVIAGMITEHKGDFSLENLPLFGNFRLKITAIGYKAYEEKVAFDLKGLRGLAGARGGGMNGGGVGDNGDMQQNMSGAQQAINAIDKDLGNIKLSEDAQTLETATVTASKPLITMGVDRKIYNVEKDISAAGGSATDVMRNVPSVQVDIDGNVTLRNSPPTIFVDGRPTTLTLDQIPADAIQSVEIITNPGAKYDASGGTAGILNIVLKKNRKAGYNGNVRAGVDQRGKLNLGGDINVKQGKVNFFLAGNFNQRRSIGTGDETRYSFLPTPADSLREHDYSVNDGFFAFGRGGIDYFMDNRNTLSVAGNIVHGTFNPSSTSDIFIDYPDSFYNGSTASSYTQRLSTTNAQFNNHGVSLSFKHNFPRAGEEWTADANYSQGGNNNTNLVTSNTHDVNGGPITSVYQQKQLGNSNNKYFTAQTDYTLPLGEKSKFETGARVAIRNNNSINDIDTLGSDNQFHTAGLLSSQYTYQDRVFAGYATYGNVIGNFTYMLGLRGESSDYRGTQHYTAFDSASGHQSSAVGEFSSTFPISLFPSIFLTQKLGGDQDLSLNYTRRIDRPNFFQLFPFTDYSDSLNPSRGNPALLPQFTNSFELGYQKSFPGNNTLLLSTYYKSSTNLITRISVPGENPVSKRPVYVSTFINAKSSFVGGFEVISRNTITKWWDVTSNINVFTSKINTIDTGLFAIPSIGEIWSWYGKINNSFKIYSKPNKALTLQLSGDYTSKTVLPPGGSASNGGGGMGRGFGPNVSGNANGYSKPSGGVDGALRFEFLKNKVASLTLSVSDIFRTRVYDVFTQTNFYTQDMLRRRDPQFFRLQFNWRFGKFDMALFKRKNMKGDMDNMQNMQGGGMGPGGGGGGPQN
ncbi:MAG TPA: outer membrane beta-barrel protein [Puia sp.]|nr:outer membrane beta-barrel protein [Puia sp.]